jgi:predicted amidohydrolase YtcJ
MDRSHPPYVHDVDDNVYKWCLIVYNPGERTPLPEVIERMRSAVGLIVRNARFPTGRADADALAVIDGRIGWLGRSDASRRFEDAGTVVLDAGGLPVLPAFVDSHTHFKRSTIVRAYFIDFRDVAPRSIDDVLDAVAAKVASVGPGTWVQGDSLNDVSLVEGRFPTRHELDSVSDGHPVVLRSIGRHVVAANSAALHAAGIDRESVPPPGGRIDRDADGEPTGVLHEQGKLRLDMTASDTVIPRFSDAERVHALRAGMGYLHRHGIAGIHEMAREADEVGDYLRLREEDGLSVRVRMYIRGIESATRLEYLLGLGLRTGLGDDWFRLGGVKFSIDGSGLARNAAVYDPYPGQPDNRGLLRIQPDELEVAVADAHRGGLQIALHAVGQRAFDLALGAFERLPAAEVAARRHRIEHAYYPPRPGQFDRMRAMGLVWSTQPGEIEEVGDDWLRIFGTDRLKGLMPIRTARELGILTLINSDFPVTSIDPFLGIRSAVERRTAGGLPLGPEESVTMSEALEMMTVAPARVEGRTDKGVIEPGALADLVVLSDDPLSIDPSRRRDLRVVSTIVGGVVRYSEGSSKG